MPILNFGSCCIDNVYFVPHFVAPGETLPCTRHEIHPGGKGLNQSLAMAAAGADVRHAGCLGADGGWLKDLLTSQGVNTDHLRVAEGASGHANIQVTPAGENAIVLYGGTNREITQSDVDLVLAGSTEGDILVLQNEISCLDYIVDSAAKLGMRIMFNAAPMTDSVADLNLSALDTLIVNEIEGAALTGMTDPDAIIESLLGSYPRTGVVLTLGSDGVIYADTDERFEHPAETVDAVDTTGAGDTFTGFFIAGYSTGKSIPECLALASKAAAICVTREGAASSIPTLAECQ